MDIAKALTATWSSPLQGTDHPVSPFFETEVANYPLSYLQPEA